MFIGGLGCHVEWRGGFEAGAVLVGRCCESLLFLTLEAKDCVRDLQQALERL
jgi:hypothetical protein